VEEWMRDNEDDNEDVDVGDHGEECIRDTG
jgi:hypothetical protein